MVTMMEYIKNIIKDFLEEIVGTKTAPASDHLFTARDVYRPGVIADHQIGYLNQCRCYPYQRNG